MCIPQGGHTHRLGTTAFDMEALHLEAMGMSWNCASRSIAPLGARSLCVDWLSGPAEHRLGEEIPWVAACRLSQERKRHCVGCGDRTVWSEEKLSAELLAYLPLSSG